MSEELAKSFDPAAVQTEVQAVWDREKAFHAEPTDPGEPYSIVIPPPNVTAALHLGHALNNTLQDILVRRARMQGKNAIWLPGTDHAGIATQTVVEKRVMQEEGKRRTDFDRDVFVKKIQAWKDEYEKVILGQLKSMGCSCDWDRTAFTMDEPRAKAVREGFFQLFKAGLIYRGKRLVNWDPVTQTALADDEVENEEIDGFFYYLKYPVVTPGNHGQDAHATEYVTVATTRPETMLGDTAVAINPKDPRAVALRGKKVLLPIVNREIPIVEDDYVVLPVSLGGDPADTKAQMATGFLKVTPAHDTNDYEIGKRHNLDVINIMAPDASISDKHGWTDTGDAGFLLGKSREEARKLVVKWFKEKGLLEDQKPYRHSVGHSYRSHVAIEPYLSDQWYCKVTDDKLRGAALRAMDKSQTSGTGFQPVNHGQDAHATDGGLKFYPERYAKTYQTWHENIRDWCISRQLWWGHRIPVWSKRITITPENRVMLVGSGDLEFLDAGDPIYGWYTGDDTATQLPLGTVLFQHVETGRTFYFENDQSGPPQACLPWVNENIQGEFDVFVCLNDAPKLQERIEKYGYIQDPDVLDTWFSSGLWPLSTLGWPAETPELAKWNPTSVLCTAREIITLWVSRMVMFNEFFKGQIPFKDVFIHAMIQDGEGRKMSKSLGNGVDPLDIISSHGTDAMRFTLTSMATNTQDVRMPVVRDESTGKNTSPKFDLGRNFSNKMWNAARFVLMSIKDIAIEPVDESKWTIADKWIITRFNKTVAECDEAIANYRFDVYARACYDFFWRDFCDWYVECAKVQLKSDDTKAQTANIIASVLDASLRLMQPAIPFITEKLWWKLNEEVPQRGIDGWINSSSSSQRIIKAAWPIAGKTDDASEAVFARIQEIVTAIRTLRNDYKVEPRKSISISIKAPAQTASQIESLRETFESLCIAKIAAIGTDIAPPIDATSTRSGDCEIFAEGLVDQAAELQRKTKRREELVKAIAAKKGRLSNAGYVAKAPPHLVKETQDQLAAEEAELASLG